MSCLMVFQSQGCDVTLGEVVLGSRFRNCHVTLAKVRSESPVRKSCEMIMLQVGVLLGSWVRNNDR